MEENRCPTESERGTEKRGVKFQEEKCQLSYVIFFFFWFIGLEAKGEDVEVIHRDVVV